MNSVEKRLMAQIPYMQCGPRVEFQQRLQWLSEGMLRNHMESIVNYKIDLNEIEQYKLFKENEMSKEIINEVHRPLSEIAREIHKCWSPMYFGAVPYYQAMRELDKITDSYGLDDAKTIVIYFLSNATTWRGEDARRIKAELKLMAGIK